MTLLSTTTGAENGQGWNAKAYTFLMAGEPCPTDKEIHLSKAAKEIPNIVRKQGSPQSYPALNNTREEIGGRWTDTVYELTEGTYVKIWCDSKFGFGSAHLRAAAIFRMREAAAYHRFSFNLPNQPTSTKARLDFTGRMDRVTLEEALAVGLKIPAPFRHFYEEYEVRDCFSITVLEKARVEKPKVSIVEVETEAGETKKVIVARRRRKLNLQK